jgi:hypothetical protein
MGSNPITRSNVQPPAKGGRAVSIQLEQSEITPEFLQATKLVAELPHEQQNELAQLLLEEIADLAWESSPEFRAAIDEAEAEYAAGDCVTFEEYNRQRRAEG